MRENGLRALGGLAQRLTSGLAKGRGASIARLRADWPVIVGPELARTTRPDALLAGRGGRTGAKVLRMRVSSAAALEVQHMTSQIVERVNAYFGHRQIDDIRLTQGIIPQPPVPRAPPAPSPEVAAQMASRVADVADSDLRAALARLGARVAINRRGAMVGLLAAPFLAREGRAQLPSAEKLLGPMPGDHVLGRPEAPNIIIDYFSLTCPHCANFHAAVLPELKRQWIDTGRARFIYRHFPSDSVATHAAQLAECAGPAKFFDAVDVLFRSQIDWLTGSTPEVDMVAALEKAGMTEGAACLAEDRHLDKVVGDVLSGQQLRVTFTPTLFINEQNYGNPGGAEGINAILGQVAR